MGWDMLKLKSVLTYGYDWIAIILHFTEKEIVVYWASKSELGSGKIVLPLPEANPPSTLIKDSYLPAHRQPLERYA